MGQNVKASVHTQSKANKFKDQNGIDTVSIDFYKPETIADAFRHVDRVFLLTPPSPDMTNLYSTLITEAKKNDIKYIVKLSVIGADIEPGITIGRLHRQEEKIIEESGIPYTFLLKMKIKRMILQAKKPYHTLKQQKSFPRNLVEKYRT